MSDRNLLRRIGVISTALAIVTPGTAAAQAARAIPKAAFRTLINEDDYPSSALLANEQGVVHFRLAVDQAGKVTGCTVLKSSGSKALDTTTCEILTARAVFRPARDSAGQAIVGSYDGKLGWKIVTTTMPGLQAATAAWGDCAIPRAMQMAGGSGTLELIIEEAFAGCLKQERKVVDLLQSIRPVKLAPAAASADARRSLRGGLVNTINGLRAGRR